ncbi:MAG: Ig-like domain-containing protein [Planctomycetota bacterium]
MIQRTDSESRNRQNASQREGARRRRSRSQRRRLLMEGLEARQLLASDLPDLPADFLQLSEPRNIGSVPAFVVNEVETTPGTNDFLGGAQLVPLGTGAGDEDTIDVNGSMGLTVNNAGVITTDIDTYAFDLRAGDILDLAITGAGSNLTVFHPNGRLWFGTDLNTSVGYPSGSPLQTLGNAAAAQVVPEDGRYFVQLAPSLGSANYTLGLRAYRPVLETAPIGSGQVIFLDFDGGIFPTSDFGNTAGNPLGVVRFQGLDANLATLGFINPNNPEDVDAIIDYILEEIPQHFESVATGGSNGDFSTTGIAGEFGLKILNSRDHADPGNHPLVTRVIFGTDQELTTQGLFGIAQSIDVGNFRPNESVLIGLDAHLASAAGYPLSPSVSLSDAIAQQMAGTISHEAGHSFGIWHTNGQNAVNNLMDEGSASLDDFSQGIGPDGIFGTSDDLVPGFFNDQFSLNEFFFGIEEVPKGLSHALSTGLVGTPVTGFVFEDANADSSAAGDSGLAGVTVFADLNANGVLDVTDASAVSDANGQVTLNVPSGTFNVVALTPDQFAPTTPTTVSVGAGGSVSFGFNQVIPDITGTKWADVNGNGLFDANESGIGGFYIYLDLDGDDRPDLGEPSAVTADDGTYTIDFPGPGTYTIREVVPPGFIQTFPATGEHTVVFTGAALAGNFNFGNLPSRDYGDAPDTYLTSVSAGGPSHGLDANVFLGSEVDRETDGLPSADALGDDSNNVDDEDGVQLLTPLGPGGTATFGVTATNTGGTQAFLQGWIDFDGSGTFESDEQVFDNVVLATGLSQLQVDVPADAQVGSTFARFRYSPTPSLGVGGEADSGEVEDYQFDILQAAQIANDDEFTVSRNSLANELDVLANDFQTDVTQLQIVSLGLAGTQGTVVIDSTGGSVDYTPPNGFTGLDVFQYTVQDQFGDTHTATVNVTVNFQSNVPIAVDDTFEVPEGSSNRALNVLDNDVPSIFGGLTIISVSAGDQGGRIDIEGGGQTIRYTPQPGFAGTEQFTYSIQDANGAVSTAQVTVNTLPGARDDDLLNFTIGIFDITNDLEIDNVQVGDTFNVRVFVDEINNPAFSPEGVAAAFLDLLYTDELVSTQDTTGNGFGFDISFGPNFQGGFQLGSASTPGLIDEVGAVQPIALDGELIEHSGPAELFTITMTAVSPGVAIFASDPADTLIAETILVDEDVALTPAQLGLGTAELTIFPANADFSSAIDDAFVNGDDSNGTLIEFGAMNVLDVLANDNLGPTGVIQEFGIVTAPGQGTVSINDNGTPSDLNDDFITFDANINANGFDSFTYLIVTADGVRSTAEVTLAIGNAADDDIVEFSFGLVDEFGNSITSVSGGDTFGVEFFVEDLRTAFEGNTYVFAGYLDVLYDSGLITPGTPPVGSRFDFDVEFDSDFDADAGVGTAVRPGIIDEFGSLLQQAVAEGGSVAEPNLMATLFFVAADVSSATTTTVIGSPADASPFQDTLLFDRDEIVEVSQIRYNELSITINVAGPSQNSALPEDVNEDGNVTPIDALAVINTIGAGEGESTGRPKFATDVNGDKATTPLDALLVINYLSNQQNNSGAEAESTQLLSSSSSAEGEMVFDDAIEDLCTGPKLTGGMSGGANGSGSGAGSDFITTSDSSDDDDELLGLLADDQSSL